MRNFWFFLSFFNMLLLITNSAIAQQTIRYGGATTLQNGYMPQAAEIFSRGKNVEFVILGGNTTPGMKLLLEGRLDIAGGGRFLTESEKQQGLVEVQVGWDALIPIVNINNPVTDITLDQLKAVFKGDITNWRTLGGDDQIISLYIAPKKSGIRKAQKKLLLEGAHFARNARQTPRVPSNAIPIIAHKKSGLAVISKGLIVSNPNPAIKTLTINGITPTPQTIKNQQYKLVKPLILATKGEAQGLVKDFIHFTLGEEGKIIINKSFFTLE